MAKKTTNQETIEQNSKLEKQNLINQEQIQQLQAKLKRYEEIISIKNEGIWGWDIKTNEVEFDNLYYEIAGYSPNEFPPTLEEFKKRVHPDDSHQVWQKAQMCISDEIDRYFSEFRFKHKDGSWMWIQSTGKIIERDQSHNPIRFMGTHTDITHLKEAEDEIKKSRQKLLEAQYVAKIGDFTWDIESGTVTWSKGMRKLLKYDENEEIDYTKVNVNIHHPDDLERVTEWLNKSIQAGKEQLLPNEYRLICKDGQYIHVHTEGRIEYKNGKAVTIFGTCQDITQLKETEQELKKSKALLVETQQLSGFGSWEYDINTNDVYWSEVTYKILGFDDKKGLLTFEDFVETISKEQQSELYEKLEKVISEKAPQQQEFCHTKPDGGIVYTYSRSSPVVENGKVIKIIGSIQDITERKKSELALKESEQNLKTTLNSIGDAVIATDIEGHIVSMNPVAMSLTGWDYNDAKGKKLSDVFVIINTYTSNPAENPVEHVLKHNRIISLANHTVLIAKDGSRYQISDSASPIKDANGKITGVVMVFRDVSEEYKMQEVLKDSEKKYRDIFEYAPIAIFYFSKDGIITHFNEPFIDILGSSKNVLLGLDMFNKLENRNLVSKIKEALEQGFAIYEDWYSSVTGHKRAYIRAVFKAIKDKNGETIAGLGIVEDFTERKKVELALRQSEKNLQEKNHQYKLQNRELKQAQKVLEENKQLLQDISDNMFDLVSLADYQGNLTFLNKAHETIGYKVHELVGKNAFELIHPDDRERMQVIFNQFIKEKKTVRVEYRAKKANGETLLLETIGKVLPNNQILFSTRDITERKRAEDALQRASKLESIGTLAGGIAHDFNNLLTGIYGNIELAKLLSEKNKVHKFLDKTLNTIERAQNLTGQLLTFAKGGSPVKKVQNIRPFLIETIQFALSGSNITCQFDLDDDLSYCDVDIFQISQAIDNIIINAKQAMPEGGKIQIEVKNVELKENEKVETLPGNYVRIMIKDSGVGISNDVLPRIFDPFFTTKVKGYGIGLSTTYSIITRHNGVIEVESQIGVGTTFYIYLPAASKEDEFSGLSENDEHTGSGLFLIMDDEVVVRESLKDILEIFGYQVVTFENGEQAVDYFYNIDEACDRIIGMIFDLTVPGGMGGLEAVKKIRQICEKITVFVASGYADDPIMAKPEAYGFTASIKKPFKIRSLIALLNTYITRDDE